MSNLWCFGDSFVDNKDYRPFRNPPRKIVDNHWTQEVAKALNLNLQNYGLCGTALSYTYCKVFENMQNFKDNDVIVVALTSTERRWFFYNSPQVVNDLETAEGTTKEQVKAYKQYILHLNENPVEHRVYMHNFLKTLEYIALTTKVKIIVMNCFGLERAFVDTILGDIKHIHYPQFPLGSIAEWEYKGLKTFRPDFRISHLTRSNHNILANKIIEHVKHGTDIDLFTGFETEFIDNNFLKNDHSWELFDYDVSKAWNGKTINWKKLT